MAALEDTNVQLLISGLAGMLFGIFMMYLFTRDRSVDDEKRPFTMKEIEKWHLKDEWAYILSGKGKKTPREIALEELELLAKIEETREEEYQSLKKRIREASKEFQKETENVSNETTPIMKYATAQTTLAAITGKITNLRKLTEGHLNALIPIQWRKEFLQAVRDENSRLTIKKQLNRESLIIQIKDNMTHQIDFLQSELDALTGGDEAGTKELYTKLFGLELD
jgi:predicted transcriptional regulator|tara:strand:- start:600 stop:1271 length:672 start_codon:yes stop_codon:yes gene_type:complete